MKILFRAPSSFFDQIRKDLARPHPFAWERVAWVTARAAAGADHIVLLGADYFPVANTDYVKDPRVGAMMSQEAIRKALEVALLNPFGIFHIHMHDHKGTPGFSAVDLREQPKFVPDFFKVRPELPHGALVLSHDRLAGRVWFSPDKVSRISEFDLGGPQLSVHSDIPARERGIVV